MAGNFYRVRCEDCDNEQVVFENAATVVECADCGAELVTPSGGKAAIAGDVTETVEAAFSKTVCSFSQSGHATRRKSPAMVTP